MQYEEVMTESGYDDTDFVSSVTEEEDLTDIEIMATFVSQLCC